MAFWDTPPGNFPLMLVSWLSAVMYFIMVYAIIRERKVMMRSSYIPVFLIHSLGDFLMFIQIETLSRPRKYNWFGLFNDKMDHLAQFTFLWSGILLYCRYVGHVVTAFNRFTVVAFPVDHSGMWSLPVILIFAFSSWWLGILLTAPGVILYASDMHFQFQSNGILLLIGGRFNEYDSYFGSIAASAALLLCIFFYSYSIFRLKGLRSSSKFVAEKKFLICALFSFLPFLLGAIRGSLTFLSAVFNMPNLWAISNDLWAYDCELNFCCQVWINVLLVRQIRRSVKRVICGEEAQNNQTSVENPSSKRTNQPIIVQPRSTDSKV